MADVKVPFSGEALVTIPNMPGPGPAPAGVKWKRFVRDSSGGGTEQIPGPFVVTFVSGHAVSAGVPVVPGYFVPAGEDISLSGSSAVVCGYEPL